MVKMHIMTTPCLLMSVGRIIAIENRIIFKIVELDYYNRIQ